MTTVSIRRATAEDAEPVAALIGTAFAEMAAVAWLVPEPAARASTMTANFRIFVAHALAHGFIDMIADQEGPCAAAVWFPLTTGPMPEPEDYQRRLAEACAPWTERFQLLDELFEAHHPEEPHDYLMLLAVHPERQGTGLGSVLLRHHHTTLDAAGTAAYLEASNTRNRDLYLRHGYRLRGEPLRLPDGTPFFPMWRPPEA
jgi:GNAT superfamily N-acetyltransferase